MEIYYIRGQKRRKKLSPDELEKKNIQDYFSKRAAKWNKELKKKINANHSTMPARLIELIGKEKNNNARFVFDSVDKFVLLSARKHELKN